MTNMAGRPVANASRRTSLIGRWALRLAWIYLISLLVFWLLFRLTADRWWAMTVFLFGPRWIVATPLLLLVPLALWVRSRWSIALLAVSGLIIAGPITGGTISPSIQLSDTQDKGRIRVLTSNTDGSDLNIPALKALIASTRPDIVFLQELNGASDVNSVFPKGWHICPGPSGLRVASRFPIKDSAFLGERELDWKGAVGRYRLTTAFGELVVVNVHLPTPRNGFEYIVHANSAGIKAIKEQITERDNVSAKARAWLGELGPTTIVAGDFNMPVESAIFGRHWSDLDDAFDQAGWGWGLTKQTRWFNVRIDHVLTGKGWHCSKVWVGPDIGSDHLPMLADLTPTDKFEP